MKGHVRKRGKHWAYVVDLGQRPVQRCSGGCGRHGVFWPGSRKLEACPNCGSALADGQQRRQEWKSGFRTKQEAQRALNEVLTRLAQGTYVEPSRRTLAGYMTDEWLPAVAARVRPTTQENYRILVQHYVLPTLGATRLQDLSPAALNGLYGSLLASGGRDGAGLAPKTVRNVHVLIHGALSDAVRWGKVMRNVADLADPPRLPRREMKVWSAEEMRRFLKSVADDRLYACWLLASTTGMRRGELLGLRWSDVDLRAGRVSIVQTATLVGHRVQFSEPKTARSRRSLALDSATMEALREHRKHQLAERLAWGSAYRESGRVFTREDGSPIHPELLADWFVSHAKRAGLPRIRLHDLRHSYATAGLAAGIPAKVVSERLGHASVGITLDTYSHVLPSMDEEAAGRVAALILG